MADADDAIVLATGAIDRVSAGTAPPPVVHSLFNAATCTVSHVVHDPVSRAAAVIDSVLDYDAAAGRLSTTSAEDIVRHVEAHGLTVEWLLETHAHADHFSAGPWLKERLGGRLAIGRAIVDVQHTFGRLFNAGAEFARDGSQFDHLFADGEIWSLGGIDAVAVHLPGHTPADVGYVIGDAVFVGDTVLMPDYGTARADFPGGDARMLYRSIRRLLALPRGTRLFLCHDYKAPGRDWFAWETTVGAQRDANVHARDGIDEEAFVTLRTARDRSLDVPKLLLPSVQVNMRAGHLPDPEDNGIRYLKIPLDAL